MWMVMDSNSELKAPADLLMGRKLRPLIPRLSTPSCCCTQNSKVLAWSRSDHFVRREMVSTRWNPTAEQLQGLEEIYRRGIRTPSAEQIQQIAAKLGRFGKIEGKNVFYWFQNHKARERQKKRRQLELLAGKKTHHKQTAGLNKRYSEIEHHKEAPVPSNCSSTPSEESSSSMNIAADGWPRLDLSSPPPPPPTNNTSITEQNQTLQLFPTGTNHHSVATPTHFIEFLPIKN